MKRDQIKPNNEKKNQEGSPLKKGVLNNNQLPNSMIQGLKIFCFLIILFAKKEGDNHEFRKENEHLQKLINEYKEFLKNQDKKKDFFSSISSNMKKMQYIKDL